ncbi:MAG: hypothetical protein D6B25_13620 [Desulfobulbaceae bacterium]|nr:MAG: hypothetical protein D6B25_13620 [Desulfobulbaceae bacterium]
MTGEFAALSGALAWAVASIMFAEIGKKVSAINLNLIKGLVAIILMILILLLMSAANAESGMQQLFMIPTQSLIILVISGIIGIGIGDTAYFGCLRRIGPQKGLMLESTAPVMAALLAMVLFQEFLSAISWAGVLMTTSGVILVVKFTGSPAIYHNSFNGILLGVAAAMAQAAGIVLSRMVLAGGGIDPLVTSLIRLSSGLLALIIWLLVRQVWTNHSKEPQSMLAALKIIYSERLLNTMFGAIFIGTVCALWLQQLAVVHTSAGIAQTLLGACPLFGMLIGWVLHGQRQPSSVWGGLLFGFCGISLIFLA